MTATLSRVDSTYIESGQRTIKIFEYGAKTSDECSPFGIDSNPVADLDAVLLETEIAGESVVIGYIQEQRYAKPGETRLYSLTGNKTLATYIHLKQNRTIEIGGNDDNLVKFSELQTVLQKIQTDINTELSKIATAIGTLGGVYVVEPIIIDTSKIKTELIKIKKSKENPVG